MSIDPSDIIYFEWHFVRITATLVYTWITLAVLIIITLFVRMGIQKKGKLSKIQNVSEALLIVIDKQIKEISQQDSSRYLPFVGTLFIFIFAANILSIIPGFISPTGSLNTTIALALCVFFAIPAYGIASRGVREYLKEYAKPSVLMLPFNIIGEFSRVISLAVRLYGNVMSSSIIAAILLGVIPLFFPAVIQLLGLLTGTIQAYIFSILAIVYIAAATKGK
ncbi:F0F1 ATP synthase subunit A [Trichococcus shcherbakoviae]|uniref:ATP synthase subunit a n=1 Tax=Trichococcus shcherbakoviae subsp. psychrophilus TaxID=2585775 RepID=A0A5C5ECP5_9LACT|nr:F0F1 ATP synthase subunit A [Trichococcus shcherbakoviae]TNV70286.1 F0F1 ATP synthase subunit A [Trichococcus shcherbakoviae subsp. psychrophilus]